MKKQDLDSSSSNSSSSRSLPPRFVDSIMGKADPKQEFQQHLGFKITQARDEKFMTKKTLAEMLDVNASYIGELEAGNKSISAFILWRIEQVLGPVGMGEIR